MAQTVLNVGSNANDGTGDTLRSSMISINSMFTELYAASPVTSQITIEGNEIKANQSNANLKLSASGTGVIELEGIQIRDNHIEGTRSNEDLYLTASGTGDLILGALRLHGTTISSDDSTAIKIAETLRVNFITSDDSSAIQLDDSVNVAGGLTVNGGDTTTQNLVVRGNLSTNTIQSDDSSQILIADAVRITGTLNAPIIVTNELSSDDSSAIQINDDVNISGQLKAGSIEGLITLTHGDTSDGSVTTSSSTTTNVDTWSTGSYRSARYDISESDNTNGRYSLHAVHVTHDGSTAYMTSSVVSSTGSSTSTFTVDIDSGNLRLRVTPLSNDSTTFKFIKTIINV
jgi:hypothetical protein